MKRNRKLSSLLIGALCMSACAMQQPKQEDTLQIESLMRVTGANAKAASMYQLGRYYQGQNRYALAIEAYQKSLLADANYAEAHNGLGVVYSRQANYEQAITSFSQALNLAPQADHIHNNLGYAQYLKGDYVAAIGSFEQALEFNPNNHKAAKNLALAQQKLGMPLMTATLNGNNAPTKPEALEMKAAQPAAYGVEVSGPITRIDQPALEIKQVAPAVFELKRYEVVSQAAQSNNAAFGKIEVSNGNGVRGMARGVGGYLKRHGFTPSRFTNHKPFNIEKTQVHYRGGYQTQAKALQQKIPGEPALVQRDDLRPGINVKVLLGQDLATQPDFYK